MIEKDETWWSRLFFYGENGGLRLVFSGGGFRKGLLPKRLPPKSLLPSKIFKKIFSGRGVGWF